MNSPAATALSLESKESYAAYYTGRYGIGCLLARRPVEAGGRFINVISDHQRRQGQGRHGTFG
jgi:hypothetical protein